MNEAKASKNYFKLLVKKLLCVIRGVGSSGSNVYISPVSNLRKSGMIFLGDNVVLEQRCRLWANGKEAGITIGNNTTIYPYALLKCNRGKIVLGKGCSVNDYSILYGYGGITIGDDVHIAAHTVIVASEHDYRLLGRENFSEDMQGKGIVIEDNVWIGANAVILDGVT
ncbi:MAG: DapH/DapD/GlmU-related protein, partial [Candidatus Omnitrophica bacterium]|nr:DapH/DapD/GlmU-related protein [Candidatus Omnitrophota bacterium]